MRLLFLFWISTLTCMHIDRVIVSSDANPAYIQFWPIVAEAWKKIGITPTLALIGDSDVDTSLGEVIRFPEIEGISTATQAQIIRLFVPVLYPNDTCIISDIDLIPLSKEYFQESIRKIEEDAFVVYRDKAYQKGVHRIPMCYVAGKGKTFSRLFGIEKKEEFASRISLWNSKGLGWSCDEQMLYKYVRKAEKKADSFFGRLFSFPVIRLGHGVEKRIDREDWRFQESLLRQGGYIDAHLPRPYLEHKEKIDTLIKVLHEQK